MLDDIGGVTEASKRMLAAYVAGDESQLVGVLEFERTRWLARGRSQADWDEQMEDLLYRRNASWVPKIEELHGQGGAFIAVGALHLCGPKSVPELLRERGYSVTRITR
jgi:uncharacterized protein YbaP (TraB family)